MIQTEPSSPPDHTQRCLNPTAITQAQHYSSLPNITSFAWIITGKQHPCSPIRGADCTLRRLLLLMAARSAAWASSSRLYPSPFPATPSTHYLSSPANKTTPSPPALPLILRPMCSTNIQNPARQPPHAIQPPHFPYPCTGSHLTCKRIPRSRGLSRTSPSAWGSAPSSRRLHGRAPSRNRWAEPPRARGPWNKSG